MNRLVMIFSLWLMAAGVVQAQTELHVKAGENTVLGDDQEQLIVDRLILEDGATVTVPPSIKQFQLIAKYAEIGDDVRIVAMGEPGKAGANGSNTSGQAQDCKQGKAGGDGADGTPGSDGTSVALRVAAMTFGSLLVDTRGGAGGVGGAGGAGQASGEFNKCTAPSGGAGGKGGNGGAGGNGGMVRVAYDILPGSTLPPNLNKRIQSLTDGGKGGIGGEGGIGGAGSEGKYINMRTLAGSKKWQGGGEPGKTGASGLAGANGARANAMIQMSMGGALAPATATKPMKVSEPASSNSAQNEQSRVALQRKIELLEQANQQQKAQLTALSTKMTRMEQQFSEQIRLLEGKVENLSQQIQD